MSLEKLEPEIRALRDRVFDQVSTDSNWNACGHKWMTSDGVAWLVNHDFPISETSKRRSVKP